MGAVPRMAHPRAARRRQLLLHRLPVRPRSRSRPPAADAIATLAALAPREMDRHRALCRRALHLRALRSVGTASRNGVARRSATSPQRWRSICCSPARPSASISVPSASSVSSRRRCRRSNCRCGSRRHAGRVERLIASRGDEMKPFRLASCAVVASWRCFSRPRSATSIAPSAWTVCRPARTTTSRWRRACPGSSWSIRAAGPASDGCRAGVMSQPSSSSSSSAV